jgi:hypothetical protein
MKTNLTKADLERLLKEGKIRGFKETKPKKQTSKKAQKRKGSKIKGWLELNLEHWCAANRLELAKEFQFDPERKWRFDWAVKSIKVAWEYEGLFSEKSGHTTVKGFTDNTDKYNEATAQGWRVVRYTALNYKQLIIDLNKLL